MRALLLLTGLLGTAASGGALSFEELQNRIDGAPPGHAVEVPAGTYRGELILRRPVTLRAQPGARLVHSPGTTGPTLWIQSPGARVENLEIEGSGEGSRRDHTAVMVTASGVTLSGLQIRGAWSGVWLDRCEDVTVSDLTMQGLVDYPFWQRGEGVRITGGKRIRLQRIELASVADGIYAEGTTAVTVEGFGVRDARYGLHIMFSSDGEASHILTSQTVAGVMIMESSHWVIRDSRLSDGYRTGSAGVRGIRAKDIRVLRTDITRQASGIEMLDLRDSLFQGNRVAENGIAWTWGGDNSGTAVEDNTHLGNLLDFAGREWEDRGAGNSEAHNHGGSPRQATSVAKTTNHIPPSFTRNYWDSWRGTDLDQDGIGDTPYRFDPESANRAATRPWAGVFLGSPWSQWSRSLPGGDSIDDHPRTKPTR